MIPQEWKLCDRVEIYVIYDMMMNCSSNCKFVNKATVLLCTKCISTVVWAAQVKAQAKTDQHFKDIVMQTELELGEESAYNQNSANLQNGAASGRC